MDAVNFELCAAVVSLVNLWTSLGPCAGQERRLWPYSENTAGMLAWLVLLWPKKKDSPVNQWSLLFLNTSAAHGLPEPQHSVYLWCWPWPPATSSWYLTVTLCFDVKTQEIRSQFLEAGVQSILKQAWMVTGLAVPDLCYGKTERSGLNVYSVSDGGLLRPRPVRALAPLPSSLTGFSPSNAALAPVYLRPTQPVEAMLLLALWLPAY